MSNINKAAVLNPFSDLTTNILDYVPRATTSEFGIVAIGSGINVDNLGRIYLDTQEYSDRLTAIEAQAASSLDTQKSEVAAAIAQVNLTQSQTITALSLEVSNLKTDLTNTITATQTDLINRADELAQDVTDITQQLTQDKAAFTQEIQDALDYLKDDASVASALRTPRKIQGVDFDGTKDISLPTFTTQTDGLVPKRIGATADNYLREDGTWVVPTDTTYALLTKASAEDGTATAANTISAQVLKEAIQYHAPTVTNIVGNAETATKLQTPRTINGVLFDGTQNISLPEAVAYSLPTASDSVLGGIKVGSGLAISNSVLSVGTLNQSTTGNAASASKVINIGNSAAYEGVWANPPYGLTLASVYINGYPTPFGNVLRLGGNGQGEFLVGWPGAPGVLAPSFIRSKRDVGPSDWTPWREIVFVDSLPSHNVGSATKLSTPRKINNVDFDGTSDITVTDDALTYMPIPYPKSSPPTGYLAMMGQAISESTYPKLYALYGAVLPDMRAYSVRGLDYGRGIDVGRTVLSQQDDAIQNIKGSLKASSQYDRNTQFIDALVADGAFSVLAGDKSYTGDGSGWGQAWGTEFDASRVVRTSTETRMKNVAFLYIVKAG